MSGACGTVSLEMSCSIMTVAAVVGRFSRELLANYVGLAQCDGYDACEQFERMKGITLFGCWAHARRKFTEALDENRALATQALCHIGKLYKVESEADEAGFSIEERKEKRIRESYPVILEFERWVQDAYLKVLPKSRTGKAIEYTFSLVPRLSRYVNGGHCIFPYWDLQVCRS